MLYQSILFNRLPDYDVIQATEMPAFFVDLNLDQVVNAICAGRQEHNLKPFFYYPLHDSDSIRYRQEVAKDLEREEIRKHINTFAQKMSMVRRYLGLVGNLYYHYHQAGWFLESAIMYCEAIKGLAEGLSTSELKSRGFLAFREFVNGYRNSEYFQLLDSETTLRKKDLSSVQYSIIIRGSRVGVRKYEAEGDYSEEVERTFEKFKQGAVKDYKVKNIKGSGFNHIEAQILDNVARLYPEIFSALDTYWQKHQNFIDETIRIFDYEVQFYITYLEYIQKMKQAGLKFCYPEVTGEDKEISEVDGFDIALANKLVGESAEVVCNDFYLKGKERIIVVTGPNQGGKTTFARMFGQLHYLACLGCSVPGRQAKLFLFDQLFTHFEKEEKIKNLRGKLHDDLVRVHEILNLATPNSIVIMNEIFNSTTLKDAVFLSKNIMEQIIDLDLLCVCVTFIDELTSLGEKTVSMVSTIVPDNPAMRTFKIIRKPSDGLAYAISIAEKYHLTYRLLKERIQG